MTAIRGPAIYAELPETLTCCGVLLHKEEGVSELPFPHEEVKIVRYRAQNSDVFLSGRDDVGWFGFAKFPVVGKVTCNFVATPEESVTLLESAVFKKLQEGEALQRWFEAEKLKRES